MMLELCLLVLNLLTFQIYSLFVYVDRQTNKFYIQRRSQHTQNQLLENYKNYFDVKFLLELLTDVR